MSEVTSLKWYLHLNNILYILSLVLTSRDGGFFTLIWGSDSMGKYHPLLPFGHQHCCQKGGRIEWPRPSECIISFLRNFYNASLVENLKSQTFDTFLEIYNARCLAQLLETKGEYETCFWIENRRNARCHTGQRRLASAIQRNTSTGV